MGSFQTDRLILGSGMVTATGGSIYVNGVPMAGGTTQGQLDALSGFTTGASGSLAAQISSAAAGVSALNGISGGVNILGTGVVTVITIGQTIFVSGDTSILSGNLAATGTLLQTRIDMLSGNLITHENAISGVLDTRLSITGSGLYALLTNMSGQNVTDYATKTQLTNTGLSIQISGSQAWSAANNNSINLSGNAATTGVALGLRDTLISGIATTGLTNSGAALYGLITALSGQSNSNYATTGNLLTTGQALYNYILGTSGTIGVTGTTLYNLITALSGQTSTDYATKTMLTSTGLSIQTTGSQAWSAANNNGINLSGQFAISGTLYYNQDKLISGILTTGLFNTGSLLDGRINSLSGFTVGASGALQALIAGGGSVVKISGSSAIATADFTGIGGTLVFWSGGQVFISGAAPGAGGGVPSVNGIANAVTIAGTGNFTTVTIGNSIVISGSTLTTPQQVLFDNNGFTSGSDNLRWDYATGTLEIGQPQLNYPDNPLSIGGSGTYLQSNIRNRSNANNASSDLVITTDVGSDTSGFFDIGINNSNYSQAAYDMGAGRDGYIIINGGDIDIATATTGKVISFNTAGTRSFNLRASINDSGIFMPKTGTISFESGLEIRSDLINYRNLAYGQATLGVSGVAQRPILTFIESGIARASTVIGPAMWSRSFTAILPATTTSQTVIGNTAANVGTLSTVATEVLGQYTNIVSAATVFVAAGTSATTPYFFRGSMTGRNGFFFTTTFALADGNNATGAYTLSGARFFAGVTDRTTSATVITNDPAGNRAGLSFVWATGGTQANRFDGNWLVSSKDNSTELTGNSTMNFQTGFYRFSMYCQPWTTNNSGIYWELDDIIRQSGVQGIITGRLPVGSTALAPNVYVCAVSGGARNLRIVNVYTEVMGGGKGFF